ncbi:AraC family transcriptional regulator [Paracoccus sp. MBLB3053]|uniref:AraC family transcriptional regulator n=1 Tax=Paracoccus aurantius TaxID=3073814 RepID=A0ABU2HZF9_9RHOB|nr:AraC family transcriptional regulator [Paracoccus sp. MBLB3053]MDS9469989.1 AraC family transcriptional regulator [Paracoccus sp. MBLB3053]
MKNDEGRHVTFRRHPALPGVETLSARYMRQRFKPHAHDEYLFGVIDAGIHEVWCRGEAHRVPAGSLVTMRPGDVHHGGAGSEDGWHQRMIYIAEPEMRELIADITGKPGCGTLDFGAAFHARPELGRRFAALHAQVHGDGPALLRDTALDALLGMMLGELGALALPDDRPAPRARIAQALDYLDACHDENVSLADLCAVAGLGRRQTIAAFHRLTGMPPHAWHILRRIERAKCMLRQGARVAHVAAATGFADQSHMGRHFAAIMGVSPAIYARG